jgi:hypothetical protein
MAIVRTIASFSELEEELFDERIRFVLKKLQIGFLGRVSSAEETLFRDFTIEATRTVDEVSLLASASVYVRLSFQFVDMVHTFKQLHVLSCARSVTISKQLFVQIDVGEILSYVTLDEQLVL